MKSNNNLVLTMTLSLGMSVPSLTSAELVNGSFEDPQISGWKVSQSIPGWKTASGAGIEVQHGVAGTAKDGKQLVELDSNNSTAIYQEVQTEPGQTYRLIFNFSPRPKTEATDNKLQVSWDGQVIATLEGGQGGEDTQWTEYSYPVEAQKEVTRLEFKDVGTSNSLGTYLDEVSLKPLLINGSFEDPQISGWKVSQSIPGWKTASGAGIEVQHGVAGTAKDGKQLVELDSNNSTAIYQEVQTGPGEAYQLTFYFSPRPGTKAADNKLQVSWDGQVLATLEGGQGGKETQWTEYSYSVTAQKKVTRLEFKDVGTSNGLGTYLDKVSLKPSKAPDDQSSPSQPAGESSGEFSCEEKKTCGEMASCEEARYHLKTCGNKGLDRDSDGIPCETICK